MTGEKTAYATILILPVTAHGAASLPSKTIMPHAAFILQVHTNITLDTPTGI